MSISKLKSSRQWSLIQQFGDDLKVGFTYRNYLGIRKVSLEKNNLPYLAKNLACIYIHFSKNQSIIKTKLFESDFISQTSRRTKSKQTHTSTSIKIREYRRRYTKIEKNMHNINLKGEPRPTKTKNNWLPIHNSSTKLKEKSIEKMPKKTGPQKICAKKNICSMINVNKGLKQKKSFFMLAGRCPSWLHPLAAASGFWWQHLNFLQRSPRAHRCMTEHRSMLVDHHTLSGLR